MAKNQQPLHRSKLVGLAVALAFLSLGLLSVFLVPNGNNGIRRRLTTMVVDANNNERNNIDFKNRNLRVLTLGSSRAWGSGLDDPSTESYTALLNGENKAIRSSNAEYAHKCIYSMIGDAIYDVILIEYMPQSYAENSESLLSLGIRLRRRFPDSVIIYINIWSNHQFINLAKKQGLREQAKEEKGIALMDGALQRVAEKTLDKDLLFLESKGEWLREAVKDPRINGEVLHYDLPIGGNYPDDIIKLAKYYLPDMIHLNSDGHKWIKNQTVALLHKLNKQRSDRVDPWDSTDKCKNWLHTGEITVQTSMHRSCFSQCTKFALIKDAASKMDYIEIVNDSGKPQHLYLSHFTSGPADVYGGATVTVVNGNNKYSIPINTYAGVSTYPIYDMKQTYLGQIQEGNTLLQIVQDKTEEVQSFLTTGIIMTPDHI